MDPRVTEILEKATDSQRRYVRARLINDSIPKAARAIGLTRTAPHQWPNLDELEEAVGILYRDVIEAAKLALEDLALEAVQALGRAVRGKGGNSITAAKAILDRIAPYAAAYKLLGAGGGGYLVIFAKDEDAGRHLKQDLTENPPNTAARFVDLELSSNGLQVTRS